MSATPDFESIDPYTGHEFSHVQSVPVEFYTPFQQEMDRQRTYRQLLSERSQECIAISAARIQIDTWTRRLKAAEKRRDELTQRLEAM